MEDTRLRRLNSNLPLPHSSESLAAGMTGEPAPAPAATSTGRGRNALSQAGPAPKHPPTRRQVAMRGCPSQAPGVRLHMVSLCHPGACICRERSPAARRGPVAFRMPDTFSVGPVMPPRAPAGEALQPGADVPVPAPEGVPAISDRQAEAAGSQHPGDERRHRIAASPSVGQWRRPRAGTPSAPPPASMAALARSSLLFPMMLPEGRPSDCTGSCSLTWFLVCSRCAGDRRAAGDVPPQTGLSARGLAPVCRAGGACGTRRWKRGQCIRIGPVYHPQHEPRHPAPREVCA